MILLLICALVYTYIAVYITSWASEGNALEAMTAALVMAVWPIGLPFAYLYGTIRLRIKWRKYRGGLYLRKTFNAAAIDDHIAKYGS